MPLKLSDLSIDTRQLGTQYILTGVNDDFKYENGQKTNERVGTRYEVVLPQFKFEKINVKIPGPQMISNDLLKDSELHTVHFQNLIVHFYSSGGRGYALTGKADAVTLDE